MIDEKVRIWTSILEAMDEEYPNFYVIWASILMSGRNSFDISRVKVCTDMYNKYTSNIPKENLKELEKKLEKKCGCNYKLLLGKALFNIDRTVDGVQLSFHEGNYLSI